MSPETSRPLSAPRVASYGGFTGRDVRAANSSAALTIILREGGDASRARIAQLTGSTRATVSRLVEELVTAGLVTESQVPAQGRGRPAIALKVTPGALIALGLEVNVTYMTARVIDLAGQELAAETITHDSAADDVPTILDNLHDLGQRVLSEGVSRARDVAAEARADNGPGPEPRYMGCGLALPGLVSTDEVAIAPNLGWRHVPLSQVRETLSDLRLLRVANEADLAAFAFAHPRPGAADGPDSFIYVSGEYGVGGGIIVDHAPMPGAHGWSGEIGHICVDPAGPRCACGALGCLESYLGLGALTQAAGLPQPATVTELVTRAQAGDQRVLDVLGQGGLALGRALATVINTVDIPLVVLGGHVSELAPWLLEGAREELSRRVPHAEWLQPQIEVNDDSVPLASTGAAAHVLQMAVNDPLAALGIS